MNARRPARRDEGGIMVISMIAMIPVLALVTFSLLRADSEARAEEIRREADRACENALSGIELAKAAITTSTYGTIGGRNDVIWEALGRADAGDLRWDPERRLVMAFSKTDGRRTWVPLSAIGEPEDDVFAYRRLGDFDLGPGASVTTWIVPLEGYWHMVEAEARVGRVRRTARVFVRERDPFTRYNLFVDRVTQPVSVDMTGDVHSNKALKYYYGGLEMGGFMTAVNGFSWVFGADWTNIGFKGGHNEAAAAIALPDLAAIRTRLRPSVPDVGQCDVANDHVYVGSDWHQVEIDLEGDTVRVEARHVATGSTATVYDGPVADIRRIYAVNDITMRGELNGRLSVANESSKGIHIDGNIVYVDDEGDPAWEGLGGGGVDVVDDYQPNPAYDGRSSLGILAAAGDVTYAVDDGKDLELHAAVFSQGQISIPGVGIAGPWAPYPYNEPSKYREGQVYTYDSSIKPRFLFTVGMSASSRHKIRGIVGGDGRRRAGFEGGKYVYDAQLLDNPPPYFIDIERPVFRGRHLLEGRAGR